MTVKVKYENGVLRPLEKVRLEDEKVYEIEIKEEKFTKTFKASDLQGIDCITNELISVIGKRLNEAKRTKEYREIVNKALEYIKLEKLFPVYDLVIPIDF